MNYFLAKNKDVKPCKGKLKGYTISVKDNICTKGLETTAGSQILKGYKPVFDATVIEKIKASGGDILAKANMDEFGFGSFNINTHKVPQNPLDKSRVTGGSSGGSAAAVKDLDNHISIAESTGGSIANPASFCGVVGYTPTYGLVSRYGLIDYANSLDKIGIVSRKVRECKMMMNIIQGQDFKDSTSIKHEEDYEKKSLEVKGMTLGVPKEYLEASKEVKEAFEKTISQLKSKGVKIKSVSLKKNANYSIPTYYLIAMSEASTNLAKYSGLRYGVEGNTNLKYNDYFKQVRTEYFGDEAKRRIVLGTYARMAGFREQYYDKALRVRTLLIDEYKEVFKEVDAIIHPTMPMVAPRFEEVKNLDPLAIYQMDLLTVGANLGGFPHISIPMKKEGLPAGIMITGNHLEDFKVLSIGEHIEN